MFTIAIIKKNKFKVDTNLTKEFFFEQIKDYVNIVSVDSIDKMMETVVLSTGQTSDKLGHSSIVYQDSNNVYQLCHLKENNNSDDDVNGISSYLVIGKETIYGNTILVNSTIMDNGTCVPNSVTLDTISTLLYDKFNFKAVYVSTTDQFNDFTFQKNPIVEYLDKDAAEYDHIDVNICNFNLIVYYQKDPEVNVINKKTTKLVGDTQVYGDVIVCSFSTENEFGSIDTTTLLNIIKIASGDMKKRIVLKEESREGAEIDKLPVVTNKYTLLNNRLINHVEICNYCNRENASLTCTGCYRIKYCSKECQRDDWHRHKDDCACKNIINKKNMLTNTINE